MKKEFASGTVILKNDVRLPEGVKMDAEPCAPGWKVLANMDGYGFDRAIREAGGNFLCVAEMMKITAVGGPSSNRMERGIKKLGARAIAGKFNALEIMEVSAKSFLGVPYVRISARSRHIQQSMFLVPQRNRISPVKDPDVELTPAPAFP